MSVFKQCNLKNSENILNKVVAIWKERFNAVSARCRETFMTTFCDISSWSDVWDMAVLVNFPTSLPVKSLFSSKASRYFPISNEDVICESAFCEFYSMNNTSENAETLIDLFLSKYTLIFGLVENHLT